MRMGGAKEDVLLRMNLILTGIKWSFLQLVMKQKRPETLTTLSEKHIRSNYF